jgi:hypothetical protein
MVPNEEDQTMNEGSSNQPKETNSGGAGPLETPGQQGETPPVPVESHYLVFKDIENKIKDRLSELDHPYYFTGFRIAYDRLNSGNEPHVLPFSVEFGYLGLLDYPLQCGEPEEIPDEAGSELTENAPLTLEFLDELFDSAEAALQKETEEPLRVGISIVLNGSRDQGYFIGCLCGNPQNTRRQYVVPNKRTGGSKKVCRKSCAERRGR